MQLSTNTNNNSVLLKKFNLEIIILFFAFLLATAGLFISTDANANNDTTLPGKQMNAGQLAAIDTDNSSFSLVRDNAKRKLAQGMRASSADHSLKSDSDIGGFSREDGAMMGAYGDGEYAD